jgi:hypothetical protein
LFDKRGAFPVDIDPNPKGDQPEEKKDDVEAHIYSLNRNAAIPEVAEVAFGKYYIPSTEQRPQSNIVRYKPFAQLAVSNVENAIKNHYEILEWNNPDFIKLKSKDDNKDKKQNHSLLYYSLPYNAEDITTYQRAKSINDEIEIDVSSQHDFGAVWNNKSPKVANGKEINGSVSSFQNGKDINTTQNLRKQSSFETHNFYHEEAVSNNTRRLSSIGSSILNNDDEFIRDNAEMPNQTPAQKERSSKLLENFNKLQNDTITSRQNDRMKLQEAQDEESRNQLDIFLRSKYADENPQESPPKGSFSDDYNEPPDYFAISAEPPPPYDILRDNHQDNIYLNNEQISQDFDDKMSDISSTSGEAPPDYFTSTADNEEISPPRYNEEAPPDYFSSVDVNDMNNTTTGDNSSNSNQIPPINSTAVAELMPQDLLQEQSPDYYSNTTVAQAGFSNFNNDSFSNEPPPDYFQEFSNNSCISSLIIDNNSPVPLDSKANSTPSIDINENSPPSDYDFYNHDPLVDNNSITEPVSSSFIPALVDIPDINDNITSELPSDYKNELQPDYTHVSNELPTDNSIENVNTSSPSASLSENISNSQLVNSNESPPDYYSNDSIVINDDASSAPPIQEFSEFDFDNSQSNSPKQVTDFYSAVDFGDNNNGVTDTSGYNDHTDNESPDQIDDLNQDDSPSIRIPHSEHDSNPKITKRERVFNVFRNSFKF